MSMQFLVGGVDRTSNVLISSFSLQTSSSNNSDSVDFQSKMKFNLFDTVVINKNGTKIFGGIILSIIENDKAGDIILYTIHCVDYTAELDKQVVFETYTNAKLSDIFKDILSKYCAGYSNAGIVDSALTVATITFEFVFPSDCFKQLCELSGFSWYCDYDKVLHYNA